MKKPVDMKYGTVHATYDYGLIYILEYIRYKKVKVKFISTGTEVVVTSDDIRDGRVRDPSSIRTRIFGVGFNSKGKHRSTINRKQTKSYQTWYNMMQRCYSEKLHERAPTYIDCEVCDEWHDFQVFADWFEVNYIDGYELDKDLLSPPRGKLYSPDRCVFIPKNQNLKLRVKL